MNNKLNPKKLLRTSFLLALLGTVGGSVQATGSTEAKTDTLGEIAPLSPSLAQYMLPQQLRNNGLSYKPVSSPTLIGKYMPGLIVGGYFRGFFDRRIMDITWNNQPRKIMDFVEPSYFEPQMMWYVGGSISPVLSWGVEVNLINPVSGPGYNDYVFRIFNSMVMRAGFNTKKLGNFLLVAGGIEWRRLSNFTFGGNVRYNRYSIFERRPWDPGGMVKTKYASYYETGNFNQDARWGTNGFKGLMLQAFNLPYNLSGEFWYGKSQATAGITRADIVRPAHDFGGRLVKKLNGDNSISLNSYTSLSRVDSLGSGTAQFEVHSAEFSFKKFGFGLLGEFGVGAYRSPTYSQKWDNGLMVDLVFPKKITYFPLILRYYRIGKGFVNRNAAFSNSSIREVNDGYRGQTAAVIGPFGGGMGSVGDLQNNRQGANFNYEMKFGKLKVIVGNEFSQEIDLLPSSSTISYGHLNGLSWSRLTGYFPIYGLSGPYQRLGTYYRGVYEVVHQKDLVGGLPQYKRNYNSLEVQLKYKTKIFGKDLYFFNLNQFNSVQNTFSAIPVFNENAYIRQQTHEFDLYYNITRNMTIDLYYGMEFVKGNKYTDIDTNWVDVKTVNNAEVYTAGAKNPLLVQIAPSMKPRDQVMNVFGYGFDFQLSASANLYVRHRFFTYEDKNFAADKYKGNELTFELKLFF